jgi:hypothetical protein
MRASASPPLMCRDNSNTPKKYTHIATGKTIGRARLKLHTTRIPGIQ